MKSFGGKSFLPKKKEKKAKVTIIPVTTIAEVLQHALDWQGHEELRGKILSPQKEGKKPKGLKKEAEV